MNLAHPVLRGVFLSALAVLWAGCRATPGASPSYVFLWAGDSAGTASDFLAVVDANPASAEYGSVVASIPTGVAGSHPHHTELEMPASGHLLANGFHAGRTWLFDLTTPREPRILTSFDSVAGFSYPHSFIRLANGNVLATFQYRAQPQRGHSGSAHGLTPPESASTGGLVEMDERGTLIRSGSARDSSIADSLIYPYSVLPLPAFDRAVSTTTDMNADNKQATSEWLQFWRLSDLTLLRSIALQPGPRGDEHRFTGEPRLLPDGRSIYIHTFNCGLYLLRGADRDSLTASFVWAFEGTNCGVPVLTGRYWLQTVPDARAVVVLDVSNAERPREVSRLVMGDDEAPHWLAIDPTGRRLVMNSGGGVKGNRLFILNFDPASGRLSFDEKFRDPDGTRPGIALTGRSWPHGFSGTAVPHGSVFSRLDQLKELR
jgi:hypothetical protein